MSNDYIISSKEDIVNIADAIRSKLGSSDNIAFNNMKSLIENIETNGGMDEILSFFGATNYEIVNAKYYSTTLFAFENSAIDNIENIMACFIFENNLLSGVSVAIPESDSECLKTLTYIKNINSKYLFISDSNNVTSVSTPITSSEPLFEFNSNNQLCLNTYSSKTIDLYLNYTALLLYSTEE